MTNDLDASLLHRVGSSSSLRCVAEAFPDRSLIGVGLFGHATSVGSEDEPLVLLAWIRLPSISWSCDPRTTRPHCLAGQRFTRTEHPAPDHDLHVAAAISQYCLETFSDHADAEQERDDDGSRLYDQHYDSPGKCCWSR